MQINKDTRFFLLDNEAESNPASDEAEKKTCIQKHRCMHGILYFYSCSSESTTVHNKDTSELSALYS